MTAASAPAVSRPWSARRRPGAAAGRLLRLELRRSEMLWMIPVIVALFWLIVYRKNVALPPLWSVRAMTMQGSALAVFVAPVAGAAALTGSREGRRRTTDLVAGTAAPRLARQLAAWAAATCWAMVAYLGCVGVLYGVIAHHAAWGGPLWWPAAVGAAGVPATAAIGFAAGTRWPSRFTAPLAAVATFFGLALSTEPIHGSQSYWQISPLAAGPWDLGPNAGVATFYHYLPDLPMAQVMFLAGLTLAVLGVLGLPAGAGGRGLRRSAAASTAAGLLAAGIAVALAGTGRMDARGMIAIPALHDAASDQPARYTPVCGRGAIPVCLNPAYAGYLPAVTAALAPALGQVAGLPGAPVRISQATVTYRQELGNGIGIGQAGPQVTGTPPVFRMLLPDQLAGPVMTTSELAAQVRADTGFAIVESVIGSGSEAQKAVMTALLKAAGAHFSDPAGPRPGPGAQVPPGDGTPDGGPSTALPGTPVYAAAQRFGALPATARHAWLMKHLAALRAGRITLARLP